MEIELIQLNTTHNELIEVIRATGERLAQQRQATQRLKDLAPTKRQQLVQKLRPESRSVAQAERKALLHEDYLQLLEEILEARQKLFQLKVQWEDAQMLYNARKSLDSWHKAFLF
ncbi:MAG: hypothetical protein AB8C84_02475 [Oligoflexales bacterium]